MRSKHLFAAALAAAISMPALAGGISLQSSVLKAESVALPGGSVSQRLVPAAKALPGDLMVYTLAYRNEGNLPASDVVLNNPIPTTMIYRGAGEGGEPEVSVDGVHFGRLPDLTVTGPGGNRAAKLADVTHVRWHLVQPIPAGAAGHVSFHAALR